jgi:acyl carrier protein/NAD(P)-dependent dehydrogenase (short-subunit alcohol dehydrogenase family)
VQVDIAQRDQVEKLLQRLKENVPPLRGVVHAAGVLDDGILLEQSWSRYETVMAPKVDGAWNLHRLTLNSPLDFFILFSAGASLLGSPGQGNYAAANAFLDGLAHYRRSSGLPALTINWGAWADVGMAAKLGEQGQRRWALQGMDLIKPADGMRAMERLIERDSVQAGVLPIHWKKLRPENEAEIRPLLRLLVRKESQTVEPASSGGQVSFLDRLKNTPEEEQYKLLFEHVKNEVNKVLGLDAAHAPNPRQGFTDIGLDSLMAVELSNRLQKSLDRRLPSTLTFEYPTMEVLTQYLAKDVLGIAVVDLPAKTKQRPDTSKETAADAVDEIPDDQLEDELLKELKDAGY